MAAMLERWSKRPHLLHKKTIHFYDPGCDSRSWLLFSANDFVLNLLWGTIKIARSHDLNCYFDDLDSMHKFKLLMSILWFSSFFLIVFNGLQDNWIILVEWLIWKWKFCIFWSFICKGFNVVLLLRYMVIILIYHWILTHMQHSVPFITLVK